MNHIENRKQILLELRRELVGPDPRGDQLTGDPGSRTFDEKEIRKPWRQAGTGEEILQQDRPCKRYGVGILYPLDMKQEDLEINAVPGTATLTSSPEAESTPAPPSEHLDTIASRNERTAGTDDTEDFDLSTANAYKPSSMGVTFLAEIDENTELVAEVSGGRYRSVQVSGVKSTRTWWLRSPVTGRSVFKGADIIGSNRRLVPAAERDFQNADGLDIKIELFARPHGPPEGNQFMLTACVINRKPKGNSADEAALFQVEFRVRLARDGAPLAAVLPYPAGEAFTLDEDEEEIALLYRDKRTFAVGHGCAADWTATTSEAAEEVRAECLPAVETPSITPEIRRPDGTVIDVEMRALAAIDGDMHEGYRALEQIVEGYREWIEQRRRQAISLNGSFSITAERLIKQCEDSAKRMARGIEFLKQDATALKAFQLANHAMLLQQVRGGREARAKLWDEKSKKWSMAEPFLPVDHPVVPRNRGRWRPFQIAFVLMNLRSVAEPDDDERETVELIWFPTGGGKTEAYLGLAAYSIFLRRLRAVQKKRPDEDAGTQVLMRYTLRLLTSQQFQRAAALMCAMEYLRRQKADLLGQRHFSIGLWTGGTPNYRKDAVDAHASLRKGEEPERNIVVLERCPWCRAQLGKHPKRTGKHHTVHGYDCRAGASGAQTVVAHCSDPDCTFAGKLPVEFIDEDIYDAGPGSHPVSMLIGTVDKFAMLAWRPGARQIFGRDASGAQKCSPPGLIIQDELHLISGPLGSMVGLYEAALEELCTDKRNHLDRRPKIITSTATIRSYREQVKALFGRSSAVLFPPPGLDAGDSYFARYATDEPGRRLRPGRMYVGVYAPGLGSQQTVQVRTFSAILQAPSALSAAERDPWWTLLMFYNSIRELGGALTLFYSDIPGQLANLRSRHGIEWNQLRKLLRVEELTGRLRDEEVTQAISKLEVSTASTQPGTMPVDACLASNIIEVGVDIDRLSLMAVVGQPKTTAQYIQVTGRVGRRWEERPGLIVMVYGASKPRDRSHFEKFRSYHEKLYAQVEPTSVTPFSRPTLERALHGVLAAFIRQTCAPPADTRPSPLPATIVEQFRNLLADRVGLIDPGELANLESLLTRRLKEVSLWQPMAWDPPPPGKAQQNISLLRWPGVHASNLERSMSWSTPTSMRNVDAECLLEISAIYRLLSNSAGNSQEGGS